MTTTDEFYKFIRRYNLEQSLSFVGRIAYEVFANKPQFRSSLIGQHVPTAINLWQLAFLAKSLILMSNDYRAKSLDDAELFKCANLYNDLDDPFLTKGVHEQTAEDVYNFLLRTAYQQFPHQRGFRNDLGRSLFLYLDINKEIGVDKFDMDKEFQAIHGLPILDFIVIGMAIFSLAREGEIGTPINSNIPNLQPYLVVEKVEKFLSATMTDYDGFRAAQSKEPMRPGYEKFEFNCLSKYPFVRTGRSRRIMVPIPTLVAHRVTKGIFYDLLDRYNFGGKRNDFATFFGKDIFEFYVGMMFRRLYKQGKVIPERRYGRGVETNDWIIVEANSVVLVECKTSDLTKEAKTFGDQAQLQADLRKRVIKGITTCHRTEKAISESSRGLEDLPRGKFHYLIVTFDDSFLANSPTYRGIIDPELEALLGVVPRYHVISIFDFENLFSYLEHVNLGEVLSHKENNHDWYSYDFAAFLPQFSHRVLGKELPWRNRLLDEKFREFFAGLTSRPS